MLSLAIWLFATIIVGTVAAMVGKKHGVEYLIAMFAASIVISNVVVSKIILIGPFTTTAGLVVYSITFLLTDTISEFWGKKEATKAVWSGFLALLMMVVVTQISIRLVPAPFWDGQEAFVQILSSTLRVAIASFVAYVIAQNHDVWAYHYWMKKTKGKHLWLRNNASTMASQIIDTLIFMTIAFYGVLPLVPLYIGTIILKIIIAAIDTPFLYFLRWFYEKNEPQWKSSHDSMGDIPIV